MPMLDIFKDDAFGVVSLTNAINKVKFVPGRLGQLGLFQERSVATTSIAIEEKNGVLSLVSPTPRGGPGQTLDKAKRSLRTVGIPHFEINDSIMADEVQGVRAFGEESDVEMVMAKVAERDLDHSQSLAGTQEYSRVGAFKGIITYADTTTLDLFALFGVSQEAEVDFALDDANPASGALRKKCGTVLRNIATQLDGVPMSGALSICGDAFYDDLIAHPEVRETYLATVAAAELRTGYVYESFNFGGITWENYRGAVGGTTFVHTDKCHIAPTGVPGFFNTVYGPADYVETVNTMGQRLYQKQYEMPNGKGVHLDTQMNAIEFCTRPKALIKGKRT